MKKLLASAALAAAVTVGSAGFANATVYNLNVDGCSSGCGMTSYGTVTVTGQGTGALSFDIELATVGGTSAYFNMAGKPDEGFSLVGNPTITIAGLDGVKFGDNGSQAAGSHHESAFGDFDYIVKWIGPNGNGGLPGAGIQSLLFTVTGPSPLNLDHNHVGSHDIFFTVDVATINADKTVLTGNVGATIDDHGGGVPEPATWAMMLMGFGGIGALIRRRRQAAAFA